MHWIVVSGIRPWFGQDAVAPTAPQDDKAKRKSTLRSLAHLEMPPTPVSISISVPVLSGGEGISDPLKLAHCHLRQVVEVDDGPAARRSAAHDVAACRLVVAGAVEAVAEVDLFGAAAAVAEGGEDLGCRGCLGVGQAGDEVEFDGG